MNGNPPQKRSIVFIEKAFQGRFILWMLVLILLFALCSAFVLYLLLASDLESESFSAHLRIADTWHKLGRSIIVGNAVSALFSGISVVVVVLYLSHRIAGPMYRFQRIFRRIAAGDLAVPTHLREHDQMKVLAAALEDMLVELRRRREHRLRSLGEAQELVSRIRRTGAADAEDVLSLLEGKLADAIATDRTDPP